MQSREAKVGEIREMRLRRRKSKYKMASYRRHSKILKLPPLVVYIYSHIWIPPERDLKSEWKEPPNKGGKDSIHRGARDSSGKTPQPSHSKSQLEGISKVHNFSFRAREWGSTSGTPNLRSSMWWAPKQPGFENQQELHSGELLRL